MLSAINTHLFYALLNTCSYNLGHFLARVGESGSHLKEPTVILSVSQFTRWWIQPATSFPATYFWVIYTNAGVPTISQWWWLLMSKHWGDFLAPRCFYSSPHIDNSAWVLSVPHGQHFIYWDLLCSVSRTIFVLEHSPLHTVANLHSSLREGVKKMVKFRKISWTGEPLPPAPQYI